jgi:pilus assembly protein CpaE
MNSGEHMTEQDRISVIVVDDIDESREMILRMLQFDPLIHVIGTARTGVEAIESAQKLMPDVLVMDINMPDMDGITATDAIHKKVSFVQVVILSVQNDANYMRKAMLAGARDFLSKPPMIDELIMAVKRAGELAHEEKARFVAPFQAGPLSTPALQGVANPQISLGKIITVYSSKGGVGCTTIAVNLATALKTPNNKVSLVAANLLFGDVAVSLNEHNKNTFLELLEKSDDLDPDIIEDVMIVHANTGLHIMSAPKLPELNESGHSDSMSKILTYLRQLYHYIIIDTTPYLSEIVQTSLDIADFIILVTTQDIPTIKNTNQFLSLADASGIGRDRILFVMNRYDRRVAISPERIGETLKQPVLVTIPFEDRTISNAVNRGIPFVTDNKNLLASKAINSLAELIQNKNESEESAL